jgi:hypothetical protein
MPKKKTTPSSMKELPIEPSTLHQAPFSARDVPKDESAASPAPDPCTTRPDVLQICQTNPGCTFDGRRIRSWSPPAEGRGLTFVETDCGSKWTPRAAATECTEMQVPPQELQAVFPSGEMPSQGEVRKEESAARSAPDCHALGPDLSQTCHTKPGVPSLSEVRQDESTASPAKDPCTTRSDVVQTCQTNPGCTFVGRRIRSWSPPAEGRGLSVLETVKQMPQSATTECTRTFGPPAAIVRQRGHVAFERCAPQQATTPPSQMGGQMPARIISEQPTLCPPPVQLGASEQCGQLAQGNGFAQVHVNGTVGGTPSTQLRTGIAAASVTSRATLPVTHRHEVVSRTPTAPPRVNVATATTTPAVPPAPSIESAPQPPLALPACTSFKIAAHAHKAFENGSAEISVSGTVAVSRSQNIFGKHCGGSLQVVVPCEPVGTRCSGSLQVPVQCEVVQSR